MRQSPDFGSMHQEHTFCEKPLSAHPISSDSAQPLLSGFYSASVGQLALCLHVERAQQRFVLKQMGFMRSQSAPAILLEPLRAQPAAELPLLQPVAAFLPPPHSGQQTACWESCCCLHYCHYCWLCN